MSIIISAIGVMLVLGIKKGEFTLGMTGLLGIVFLYVNIILQGYSAIKLSESNAKINPVFLNGIQMFFGGLMIYVAVTGCVLVPT